MAKGTRGTPAYVFHPAGAVPIGVRAVVVAVVAVVAGRAVAELAAVVLVAVARAVVGVAAARVAVAVAVGRVVVGAGSVARKVTLPIMPSTSARCVPILSA